MIAVIALTFFDPSFVSSPLEEDYEGIEQIVLPFYKRNSSHSAFRWLISQFAIYANA